MRKALRKLRDLLIRGNQSIARVQYLEKRLNMNSALLNALMPDVIPLKINRTYNTNISKDDVMFLYQLYHSNDFNSAVDAYFERGILAAKIIKAITNQLFTKDFKFLDFACGHGCVTRFLSYPPENIWASDIKKEAVNFVKNQFGVNGFYSTFDPEELNVKTKFDFIFVSSLFTHLPEFLFKKWLAKLVSMLTDDGCLLFSIHSNRLANSEKDFLYFPESEETIFADMNEAISDNSVYGGTYVSDNYLNRLFAELNLYSVFYGKVYWVQDLIIVSKKDIFYLKNIDFTEKAGLRVVEA